MRILIDSFSVAMYFKQGCGLKFGLDERDLELHLTNQVSLACNERPHILSE